MTGVKIAVIGIVGESVFMSLERLHGPGETAHARDIHRELGGKGFNQAVAAARFGAEVSFLGAVFASDAEAVRATAQKDGIKAHLALKDVPSAYATIETDSSGENRVTVFPGATLTARDVEMFRGEIESADLLLINNEVPEDVNIAACEIASMGGTVIMHNPAPVRDISDFVKDRVHLFIPNQHEADALGDIPNMVVTLGEFGCEMRGLGELIPSFAPPAVLDTTGAGDTFCGTLAAAYIECTDLGEACLVANAAAALEVSRRYVMPAIPKREETLEFLNKHN